MNARNYFEYNGKKYHTGMVFVVKDGDKQTDAIFICYDTDTKKYIYKIKNWSGNDCKVLAYEKYFYNNLVSITNKFDNTVRSPIIKKRKDTQVDGLFLGWMWYIFLMAISVIFKDAIGLWILESIVFFTWRKNKIKKEGTYVEW